MAALELVVTAEQAGRTVKSLLRGELGLSAGRVGRLKRTETGLTVNGRRVFVTALLRAGDRLRVDLDAAERPSSLVPAAMALEVLYEDEHLLVVNKPAGLASIPSSLSPEEPSLAQGLVHYLGPGACVHLVNRLDRGTSGVLAAAKNGWTHDALRRQLHSERFRRTYLALCQGVPCPPEGTVDQPIGRDPSSAVKRRIDPEGQRALTGYRVVAQAGPLCLVEVRPRTGRTHQIRVHMACLGCPLAGDWLYGVEDRALIGRPALHAHSLVLAHPDGGRELAVTAPLPEDMKTLLER